MLANYRTVFRDGFTKRRNFLAWRFGSGDEGAEAMHDRIEDGLRQAKLLT